MPRWMYRDALRMLGAPEREPPSSKRPMVEGLVDGAALAGAGGALIGGSLAVAQWMRRRRRRQN